MNTQLKTQSRLFKRKIALAQLLVQKIAHFQVQLIKGFGIGTLLISISMSPVLSYADVTSDNKAATENGQNGKQAELASQQAQMAKTTKTIETVKTALFGAAAILTGTLFVSSMITPAGPAAERACVIAGQVASFGGMAADITDGIINNQVMEKAMSIGMSAGMTAMSGGFQGGIFESSKDFKAAKTKWADKATSAEDKAAQSKSAKKACGTTFAMMTINTLMSANSMKVAGAAETAANNVASDIVNTKKQSLGFSGTGGGGPPNNKATQAGGGVANTPDANTGCEGLSNTDCVKKDPVALAMMSSPDFTNTMSKALGQPLDQYLNNYKGQSKEDAINAAAGAMGISPSDASSMMANADKVIQDSGLADKYMPMSYSSSGPKTAAAADTDFSKMMADMMKNLNPEDAKNGEKKDPSELVFRQMDLLSPEKLAQNKDISLFIRVGYRYRKNLTNVEQLNWSKAENLEATRSVASEKK